VSERYIIIQLSPESFPGVKFSREEFRCFVSFLRSALLQCLREYTQVDLKFTLVEHTRGPIEVTLSSMQEGLPSVLMIYEKVNQFLQEFLMQGAKNSDYSNENVYEEITH